MVSDRFHQEALPFAYRLIQFKFDDMDDFIKFFHWSNRAQQFGITGTILAQQQRAGGYVEPGRSWFAFTPISRLKMRAPIEAV